MKKTPISVVIPAYNSERLISEAVESVRNQTLSVDEIIVVDNDSTDNTQSVVAKLGVKLIQEKNRGPAAARNAGIKASRNDWIAFLDSDDLWEKEKIEWQWKAIRRFPKARLISCDAEMIVYSKRENSKPVNIYSAPEANYAETVFDDVYIYSSKFTADLFRWVWIISSSVTIHREVFNKIGLFNESLHFMEDMEFFCRTLRYFPGATVKKILAFFRRHDHNMTLDFENLEKYDVKLIDEYVVKYPEKYPPGTRDYLVERFKRSFMLKGKALAKEISKSKKSPA